VTHPGRLLPLLLFSAHPRQRGRVDRHLESVASGWDTPGLMLSDRARRLVVLLAALSGLLLAGCAAVTTMPGGFGVGAGNRVWALQPAGPTVVGSIASESSCTHQGSAAGSAGIVSGFCVATEETGLPAIAGGSQEQDLITSSENLVDQGGITQAGRSIESHGGQGAFPSVSGGAAEKNALGQQQLEGIVGNPNSQNVPVTSGNFAGGTRYIAPDGRGATFDASGQ
jgi:hypothetical protein